MLESEGFEVTVALVLAGAALLPWVYRTFFRGKFWRADQHLPHSVSRRQDWPEVVAIVPARNEADTIGEVVAAHMRCGYPGVFSVILVDDHSEDGTADIASAAAEGAERTLINETAPQLPEGWTGKLWALQHGWKKAQEKMPDARYVLLSDADIVYGQDVLYRLVDMAERGGLSAVSLMARLDSNGFWGRLLVPAFIFFFQKLYPFRWVNDPRKNTAAAAGGCVLVRADVLAELGGFEPIRDSLIDDCALARAVKGRPPARRIWLGLTRSVQSHRSNRKLSDIWAMVSRTAFTQLKTSAPLLVATVFAMVFIYLLAPAVVLSYPLHEDWIACVLGLVSWLAMAALYVPTLRVNGTPLWLAPFLPIAALLYTAMTISSAIDHWKGRGGKWKGRTYLAAAKSHAS